MAFTWIISELDSSPSLDGLDKVIRTIHYRAQKQEGGFTADLGGALGVGAPHESSFTPYDNVTKAMVESWLNEGCDLEAIEADLDAQINNALNNPIVNYPLPFEN
jgi:hypothetical protein